MCSQWPCVSATALLSPFYLQERKVMAWEQSHSTKGRCGQRQELQVQWSDVCLWRPAVRLCSFNAPDFNRGTQTMLKLSIVTDM